MSLIIPEIFNDTTYTIEVVNMKTATHLGMENVVKGLEYKLTTIYNDKAVSFIHTIDYSLENIDSVDGFTPFNLLTQDTVISWIENTDHFIYLRYSQCQQITDLIEKEAENVPLPWTI